MAVINEEIGLQGFEIVDNKIAEILVEEIKNQQDLQGFDDVVEVFLERIIPFDKNEDVAITVAFREANYGDFTTAGSQGQCLYFIDIFCSGVGNNNKTASENARKKLFRYIGLVRYILSSAKFQTLGLPLGIIGGKYLQKITLDTDYSNFGNHSNYDGSNIRFARLMFVVRVTENQKLWDGYELLGNNTNITYENSAKGTKLVFNN